MLCSVVVGYHAASILRVKWKQSQHEPLKRWYTTTTLHIVTTQKTLIWIITAKKAPKLARQFLLPGTSPPNPAMYWHLELINIWNTSQVTHWQSSMINHVWSTAVRGKKGRKERETKLVSFGQCTVGIFDTLTGLECFQHSRSGKHQFQPVQNLVGYATI